MNYDHSFVSFLYFILIIDFCESRCKYFVWWL